MSDIKCKKEVKDTETQKTQSAGQDSKPGPTKWTAWRTPCGYLTLSTPKFGSTGLVIRDASPNMVTTPWSRQWLS